MTDPMKEPWVRAYLKLAESLGPLMPKDMSYQYPFERGFTAGAVESDELREALTELEAAVSRYWQMTGKEIPERTELALQKAREALNQPAQPS